MLCLAGLLAACAGGSTGSSDDGYVAVGAGSAERVPGDAVAPTGDVVLVPLGGEGAKGAKKGSKGGG
ncbi:hypothetical protein U9R90_34810, partial [Streptomyces sp. E11-3]